MFPSVFLFKDDPAVLRALESDNLKYQDIVQLSLHLANKSASWGT